MRLGLVFLLAFASCGGEAAPKRPNVLVITVDTLRADRVEGPNAASPRLAKLLGESATFPVAATPRAKTTPALASMLSGLAPHEHGVRDLAKPLDSSIPLLQERLHDAGYATGAIVGNWVLGRERAGLARGFDLWCEQFPDRGGVPPDDVPERRATSLTDAALVALGLAQAPAEGFEPRQAFVREDRPWFLWLHYMDPHGAYQPPEGFRRAPAAPERVELDPQPGSRQRVARYNVPPEAWLDATAFDAAHVRALYDGEVAYVDSEVGRLVDRLREAGLLEGTLVVLTSDHGESLGEQQDFFEHGAHCHESTAHIPLAIRAPGVVPGARSQSASLTDVAPTLVDLLGLTPLADAADAPWRGQSLRPALAGGGTGPRALYLEKVERADLLGAVQQKAVRLGRWKLVQSYATLADSAGERHLRIVREELFDLGDPQFGEDWDMSRSPPAGAPLSDLRRRLAAYAAADSELAELGRLLEAHRKGLEDSDPEAARMLRLLGY
jgi:arylsulfatase A-like enzyme